MTKQLTDTSGQETPTFGLTLLLPPDRTLPCHHCGVRFIWTGWEQRLDGAEPAHCPGCRHLLALTRRQRGAVKWYDRRKGIGFITAADGSEVFVRRRALIYGAALRRGQLVAFRVEPAPQGPQAVEVEALPGEAT
ncbi:MAG: cold shock domain-containing protein [Caldilineales bacterium]|nr:cold shock domain-containing protein [Caldilineales bacterium]